MNPRIEFQTNPIIVLNALHTCGQKILNQQYRPDCCIAATKIMMEVSDYFGIEARPQVVTTNVYNPIYARLFRENGGPPNSNKQAKEWFDKGAWSVCIGAGKPKPGHWSGHLVGIFTTEAGKHLIDLTINQANRPKKEIGPLESVHFLIPEEGKRLACPVGNCMVVYDLINEEEAFPFRSAPDWGGERQKERNWVVNQMIREIKRIDVPSNLPNVSIIVPT